MDGSDEKSGTGQPAGRPAGQATGPRTRAAVRARQRVLRLEVGRFRARETRRVFDAALHVGVLGGERTGFVVRAQDRPALDAGLRTDVVAGLLADAADGPCSVWLARPGDITTEDDDLAWLAATRAAFAADGRELDGFYVLTRNGWHELHSGASRVWVRLRL